ncbi:Uncharacterised protein [Fusobacterium polymorphum]|jgi:hypothetical protein|uniref:Lipoprotein n=1 Tax=Fusobacterium polymorphum ATCC 10953 TaxID=393480 RepID=A5TT56_FUSNP|nr:hypothetical protein [Fusobacterium polymorphum]BEO92375.1 hypothetical protein FNCP4_15870 [Fusobacterium nucleatum]EDK88081.1 hypothetical protein FNP_0266 [Fusobacterium polymorphum ATCC 10953]UTI53670.1 hypothetical protein NLJ26_03395 [Fusobacterium polymorphum]WRL68201.1 hypothetical protein VKN78_10425 [Fusobacterium polymorphum]CKG77989.1 Uncharacterised protein [Fusobacterium polymorphum]
MLKKIVLSILSIFLIACSSIRTIRDSVEKKEVIKQAIYTSQKEVVLLGNNYDYLFEKEEAKKIVTLIDFLKVEGLKENINQIEKKIIVDENGKVKLSVNTKFKILKKNKEDINRKEQEKFIYNLKKKLEEKKIKYEIDEDNRSWNFSLSDEININGEVIKLEEHNKILEETSKQSINLNIDLIIYYPKKIRKFDALKTVGAGWGLLFFVSAISVAL